MLTISLLIVAPILIFNLPLAHATSAFGYTTIGGSADNQGDGNAVTGSKFALSETGTIQSISFGLDVNTEAEDVAVIFGIYADSSGPTGSLLCSTAATKLPIAEGWVTLDVTSPTELSAGTYWLVMNTNSSSNDIYIYYDAGDAGQRGWKIPITFPSLDFAEGWTNTDNKKFSSYANYTTTPESTPTPTPTPTPSAAPTASTEEVNNASMIWALLFGAMFFTLTMMMCMWRRRNAN